MTSPRQDPPDKNIRVLSLDGGPSTAFMLRILRSLQNKFHGFIESIDLFSGTSDGAFASLYLAQALSRNLSGAEAITGCIDFHNKLIRLFKLNRNSAIRLVSGLFSMSDGNRLFAELSKDFKNADGTLTQLGQLKRPVSIASFNATDRQTVTYTTTKTPQTSLVHAALASSAFMPILPAFRDSDESAAYSGDLMFDGAYSGNTPILSAICDALDLLQSAPASHPTPGSVSDTADDLRKILMLSMGFDVQPNEFLRKVFRLPWPPGRKNKMLYQYGWWWNALSNLQGLVSTVIQGGSMDQTNVARRLLGLDCIYRFSPGEAGIHTFVGLMLCPDLFLASATESAQSFLEGQGWTDLCFWIDCYWKKTSTQASPEV